MLGMRLSTRSHTSRWFFRGSPTPQHLIASAPLYSSPKMYDALHGILNSFRGSTMRSIADLNLCSLSAVDLAVLLGRGDLTSVELIESCVERIKTYNGSMYAVIKVETMENLYAQAKQLDDERARGHLRSPFHGLPILVKDNISTSSTGLEQTCGSWALSDSKYPGDAAIVQILRESGLIPLAKTNMTEWANLKGSTTTGGWSPVGGQTQSPYVKGGVDPGDMPLGHSNPGGSSSGSATGVALGFAPLSIGTESLGSLVTPGTRAALYVLKPTLGSVPMSGSLHTCPAFQVIGPMAKTARDLDRITAILTRKSEHLTAEAVPMHSLRIGVVSLRKWTANPKLFDVSNEEFNGQYYEELESAVNVIIREGATVFRDVNLITPKEAFEDRPGSLSVPELSKHQAKFQLTAYLEEFLQAKVRTLEEVIQFNIEHRDSELPEGHEGQESLQNASQDTLSHEEFEKSYCLVRDLCRRSIDEVLTKHNLDVILGPSESSLCAISAAAGTPIGTLPLGFAKLNGRPFGFHVIGRAESEDKILRMMSAWELCFPDARRPPPMNGLEKELTRSEV